MEGCSNTKKRDKEGKKQRKEMKKQQKIEQLAVSLQQELENFGSEKAWKQNYDQLQKKKKEDDIQAQQQKKQQKILAKEQRKLYQKQQNDENEEQEQDKSNKKCKKTNEQQDEVNLNKKIDIQIDDNQQDNDTLKKKKNKKSLENQDISIEKNDDSKQVKEGKSNKKNKKDHDIQEQVEQKQKKEIENNEQADNNVVKKKKKKQLDIQDSHQQQLSMVIEDAPKKKKQSIEINQNEVDPNPSKKIKLQDEQKKDYPPPVPQICDVTLLLFYQYVKPVWTAQQQDDAIQFCYSTLQRNGMTGRLRVGREGLNATLTGKAIQVRAFTDALRSYQPENFGQTDFKYVDGLPRNQALKGLKVWPVTEIVTYGFRTEDAPLEKGGTHLKPDEYHKKMTEPNTVMIDVRNFNESAIGKFAPPNTEVLDPMMRRSTEFPKWIDDNMNKLKGKQILMYCTGGVRCERASAFLANKGLNNIYQLDGGIHRYLEQYEDDGGHWIGKNYTFDRRFSHGAKNASVISNCTACKEPWERYQAQKKCSICQIEVLVCRKCERDKSTDFKSLKCQLCSQKGNSQKFQPQFYQNKEDLIN